MSCHLKTILLLETKVILDGGQGFNLKGDYPMTIPANFCLNKPDSFCKVNDSCNMVMFSHISKLIFSDMKKKIFQVIHINLCYFVLIFPEILFLSLS